MLTAPQNDPRSDDEYKLETYITEIAPSYNVRLVVDDRPHVVEMWKSLGLPVLAVEDPAIDPTHVRT